jgi:hypothetical protein
VASWLVQQYTIALNEAYNIELTTNEANVNVSFTNANKTKTYMVTNFKECTCKCDCYQSQSMLMPCRHIFFVRFTKGINVFDPEMVPKRLRSNLDIESQSISSQVVSSHAQIENSITAFENISKKLSRKEKYETLFRPAQELCNTLKDLPMEVFRD